MTLRAFARERGVSDAAVRKAIETGRLERSIGYDARGVPYIADPALARQEWINADPIRGPA